MFCARCGNNLPNNVIFCNRCGYRVGTPVTRPESLGTGVRKPRKKPAFRAVRTESTDSAECIFNWLTPAVLVTVFCCLPFGIPAIIFAVRANTLAELGYTEEAKKAAESAKKWHYLALGAGIPLYVAIVFLLYLYL